MSSYSKSGLWDPRLGIKFALKATPPTPLYPQLDLARFLHIPSLYSSKIAGSIDHDVDTTVSSNRSNTAATKHANGTLANDAVGDGLSSPQSGLVDSPESNTDIHSDSVSDVVPPQTSLSYNISSELFHAAREAGKGSPESFWSHTMYESRGPDGTLHKVKVHYCTSRHSTEYVCKKHFLGEEVLGFDMEWLAYATKASGPRKNVSLIQLASPGRIGLFHIALFPQKDDLVAPTLQKIMEDAKVTKVGVNIQADCTRLKNNLGIQTQGIFELSHLYKLVKYSATQRTELINKKRVALAIQMEEFLGLPLYKGDSVRSSDWTLPLSNRQITYSAADAYAGLQLYHVLDEKRQQLQPTPPRPHHAELAKPIEYISQDPDTSSELDAENETMASPSPSDASLEQHAQEPVDEKPQRDHRITAADARIREYRSAATKEVKTTPSSLRAYYLWHSNDDLNPEAIAKLLRDPPLRTNTVTSYILNAIAAEKLPYSKTRLKNEVLASLPPTVLVAGKYSSLV